MADILQSTDKFVPHKIDAKWFLRVSEGSVYLVTGDILDPHNEISCGKTISQKSIKTIGSKCAHK